MTMDQIVFNNLTEKKIKFSQLQMEILFPVLNIDGHITFNVHPNLDLTNDQRAVIQDVIDEHVAFEDLFIYVDMTELYACLQGSEIFAIATNVPIRAVLQSINADLSTLKLSADLSIKILDYCLSEALICQNSYNAVKLMLEQKGLIFSS